MSRPSDLPPPEAFTDRPHGTRARYVSGCRCDECREANNAYARLCGKLQRAGQGNPLVPATRVRRHLRRLQASGVGRRTVADIARVPPSSIGELSRGTKMHLRRQTEERILAVGAEVVTDAKLVDAAATWELLKWMLEQGYTRQELARRLGSAAKVPSLQVHRGTITARTRARVERLYREMNT